MISVSKTIKDDLIIETSSRYVQNKVFVVESSILIRLVIDVTIRAAQLSE